MGTKKCVLCATDIPEEAIICPQCRNPATKEGIAEVQRQNTTGFIIRFVIILIVTIVIGLILNKIF